MALDHALLVSLLEKPSSGYELARRFDRSIGYFWHATHQQIYRVLSRMEAGGWISAEVQAGATAPDRKVFSVTAAGRAELARWIAEPVEPEGTRDALMVKLRGAAFGDPQGLVAELKHHRATHANRLTCYRVIEARDFSGTLDPQRALQYMVLKSGLRFEQGWLEWCEEALDLLRNIKQVNDVSPSPFSKRRGDHGSRRSRAFDGSALGRPGGRPTKENS